MKRSSYIKITGATVLLLFAVMYTVSKLEIKNSIKGRVSTTLLNNENQIGSNEQSDINESSSRIYYSIFKFISNLVPTGTKD
jgi:hypothetical protein